MVRRRLEYVDSELFEVEEVGINTDRAFPI